MIGKTITDTLMNTLPKSLAVAILTVFIFISGLSVDFVGAQDTAEGSVSDRRPADLLLSKYLRFGRITTENGLSNDNIWGITKDSYGFMWFGTFEGLNRYDGKSVKVFRNDPDDPHSLSGNWIRGLYADHTGTLWIGTWGNGINQFDRETEQFIHYRHDSDNPQSLSSDAIRTTYEDRSGTLWFGTTGGLNKFNRETKQFTRYLHEPDNPNSLGNNIIEAVYEDSAGVLWIGTNGGLDRFDPATERFVHYRNNPDDPHSLSHNGVRSIIEDKSGMLWVGTYGGINKFDHETGQFIRYQHDPADPSSLSHNSVYMVYEDHAGMLWFGTWGGGLNQFDRNTETFTRYQYNPADRYSLGNDNVYQIYEDQAGMFWIATDGGGVNILDFGGKSFRHYRPIPGDPNSLSHNAVRAIYEDRAGDLWIGTNSGGLDKFDLQTEKFTNYQHDPDDPDSLRNNSVWVIHEDHMRNLWLGGLGSGLNKFEKDIEKFTHYQHDAANPHSLSSNNVWAIHEDRTGTLWFGTWGSGLNKFDSDTVQFTRYQHDPVDPSSLIHNRVTIIYEDRAGFLWIGTVGGLDRFEPETGIFTHYQHDPANSNSLGNNSVGSIHEDRRGRFWIGTWGGGLDKFDREHEQFIHYTIKDGLPSNMVFGILEDNQENLWLSTSRGLSRFNPQTETFRNYDVSDGLQSNSFLAVNAYHKSHSGELFFGGTNGFNAFYPEQIKSNPHIPPVVITNFQLANKPVSIGEDSVLQKSILETDNLVLSYRDRVFSFEFAVLNYRAPEQNRYKYRMDGLENAWNEVDRTRRFATYTNLDPGDYVFRVIGANNDGIWNEEGASIRITVTPPWWETMWFRISMVVVTIALLVGGFRWRVHGIVARRRELEIQVQTMTRAKQMQAERDRILEVSQDLISISGMDGYFKYLNPAWEKNLGYTDEELLTRKFLDFVHPDDRAKTMREIESLAAGRQTVDFENRYTHKDGSIRHLSWMATPLPDEERVYAVARDITERKQIEVSLQTSRKKAEALAASLISSQEAGSARLARELHDDIIQRLAFLKIEVDKLEMKNPSLPEPAGDKLRQIARDIGVLSSDIHMISRRLHPISLEILGLVRSIETECQNFTRLHEIPVIMDLDSTVQHPSNEISLGAYRILQEGLRNIVRHAKATGVHVTLSPKNDILHLLIKDNGIGFNPASDGVEAGLGIASMTERARLLQGSLSIESRPGKGTAIELAVPLESR
jgi:PAS domain S-box-containing protein